MTTEGKNHGNNNYASDDTNTRSRNKRKLLHHHQQRNDDYKQHHDDYNDEENHDDQPALAPRDEPCQEHQQCHLDDPTLKEYHDTMAEDKHYTTKTKAAQMTNHKEEMTDTTCHLTPENINIYDTTTSVASTGSQPASKNSNVNVAQQTTVAIQEGNEDASSYHHATLGHDTGDTLFPSLLLTPEQEGEQWSHSPLPGGTTGKGYEYLKSNQNHFDSTTIADDNVNSTGEHRTGTTSGHHPSQSQMQAPQSTSVSYPALYSNYDHFNYNYQHQGQHHPQHYSSYSYVQHPQQEHGILSTPTKRDMMNNMHGSYYYSNYPSYLYSMLSSFPQMFNYSQYQATHQNLHFGKNDDGIAGDLFMRENKKQKMLTSQYHYSTDTTDYPENHQSGLHTSPQSELMGATTTDSSLQKLPETTTMTVPSHW
eukprot:CAMPEP_0176476850 /NCGR_PEP_ID=MMETSP0200_2-20121128/284_1 /TAXON_ID=947934 /ORGANISM="Chaetoceros sp., Strain GSL56" /LENGTH=422 /DNA_ID=CAMNT_0017872571 /DNA_START=9 /DNA_END=1274 /DNA_ORIENTATION=-